MLEPDDSCHKREITLYYSDMPNSQKGPVSLKHLRSFVAVAEAGGFTQAAERLYVTPSSLTATIQQFEQALGLKLFDRTTRRVSLTQDAVGFLPVAERLLRDFDAAIADVRAVAGRQRGHVSIAAAPSVIAHILSPAIARFGEDFPNISIAVRDAGSGLVQQMVLGSGADFGLTSPWAKDPNLEFRPLLRDRFGLVCRADHPLAKQRGLAWKQLRDQPFIGLADDTGIHAMLKEVPGLPATLREARYATSSSHSLLAMLKRGLGISVLPALTALEAPLEGLVFRPLTEPVLDREICLITRRGRALSPAAQALLERVLEVVRAGALPAGVKAVGVPATPR